MSRPLADLIAISRQLRIGPPWNVQVSGIVPITVINPTTIPVPLPVIPSGIQPVSIVSPVIQPVSLISPIPLPVSGITPQLVTPTSTPLPSGILPVLVTNPSSFSIPIPLPVSSISPIPVPIFKVATAHPILSSKNYTVEGFNTFFTYTVPPGMKLRFKYGSVEMVYPSGDTGTLNWTLEVLQANASNPAPVAGGQATSSGNYYYALSPGTQTGTVVRSQTSYQEIPVNIEVMPGDTIELVGYNGTTDTTNTAIIVALNFELLEIT